MLIDNKNGNVWDLSSIAESISWTTSRVGKPASLEFKIVNDGITQDKQFTINNGDIVRFRFDGTNVFYGYVFKLGQNADQEISVSAYDQVRYLLNKDTYSFKNMETGDIIKRIAADFQLKVGRIDSTGYRIPKLNADAQTLLDIIEQANTLTLGRAGQFFVFFDDFGALSLRRVRDFNAEFYIGDGSLLTGYDYSEDIDSDTYNRIKLYRDDKQTGKHTPYQTPVNPNMGRWGILQLYQSIDDDLNAAQINEMLAQLLALKNREQRALKLDAVGDIRVRAGMYLPIVIKSLGIANLVMVEEVKHSFDGAEHTMSITLKVI
nr:hypothetical protein [Cohnella zeiphila]